MSPVVFVALPLAACALSCDTGADVTQNHPAMVHAIEALGFKDVTLVDYGLALAWDGCGSDDSIVAHAKATNAMGQRVGIIACTGLAWKGVTVRVP